ncbi:hypothetical protein F0562_029424 [Nyssa sinensis]|uniref:Kinesin motor domain-containing protein n=1 Tax=Nyssa sinensis TaxID=561372 RepID=A0A5J5B414_9ASTE|nr:hypothetical protein F0562_029424 [Nyssa sinensis]
MYRTEREQTLSGETVGLKLKLKLLDEKRREALNKILDIKGGEITNPFCQEDVFVEVKPILRSALDGHNVSIIAYGQTGTGKTFTMIQRDWWKLKVLEKWKSQISQKQVGGTLRGCGLDLLHGQMSTRHLADHIVLYI